MKKILSFLLTLFFLLACSASALACTPWCGVIGPIFDTETPTEEELALDAVQRINEDGDKIIGKRAVAQHYGDIRTEPDEYAASVGKSQQGEEYLIVGYTFVDNAVWLRVLYGNELAWISASLAEISGGGEAVIDGDDPYRDYYVGRTCRIIVNSGRARMQPDVDAPIIEYVGYDEKYTILAVESAPDNTLWFKINKDGNMCWISSGIATTN